MVSILSYRSYNSGRSRTCRLTIATGVQVDDISYPDIHDTQKALVLLLEFLLVKYLYGEHALLGDFAARLLAQVWPVRGRR